VTFISRKCNRAWNLED